MTPETLTDRALNRATLARQMLLQRSEMGIFEAVEFLVGLQGQQTHDPYIALWSRLTGFSHPALTALIASRRLARATSMRGTLHLHTPADLVALRPTVQPVLDRMWQGAFGKRRFGDNDREAVHRAGVKILDEGPMTAGELGGRLQEQFPNGEPLAKAVLLQVSEILVQIPPTRVWGSGHAPILSRAQNWLEPDALEATLSRETLVRRYLAAFGPASVNDMQSWSGLTKLSEVFEPLRTELVTFTAPDGRELFDLLDAPRPAAGTPAPVRFLPLYDNVYLGYDNRRRMLADDDAKRVNMLAEYKPAVLVDGIISAGWAVTVKKGAAVLEIEPYHQLRKADVAELERQGAGFLRFMAEAAERFDVRVLPVRP